jgi:endonuclease YncB( thermonuclease family)
MGIVVCNANSQELKLRLCGIDAPEKKQPLGQEAKQKLESMTLGKTIAFTQ